MTSYDNGTQNDYSATARIALRYMRAYRALLHGDYTMIPCCPRSLPRRSRFCDR
jgi:hypothetical protein